MGNDDLHLYVNFSLKPAMISGVDAGTEVPAYLIPHLSIPSGPGYAGDGADKQPVLE
jgi:hypothetical protein